MYLAEREHHTSAVPILLHCAVTSLYILGLGIPYEVPKFQIALADAVGVVVVSSTKSIGDVHAADI